MLAPSQWSIFRRWPNSVAYTVIFLTICGSPEASTVVAQQLNLAAPVTTESGAPRSECVDMIQRFEVLLQSNTSEVPTKKLEILRRAASAVGEDPAGCLRDYLEVLIREQREKLVALSVNGKHYTPAAIYSCGSLSKGLRCQGLVADDTTHLDEFDSPTVSLSTTDHVQLLIIPYYQPAQIDVYELDTTETQTGNSLIPVLRETDGSLKLHTQPGKRMIVCIVREMAPQLYVKYVWLMRTGLK